MIHPPAEVDPVADLLALDLVPYAAEPCTLAGSTPVDTLYSRKRVDGLLDGDPADTIYDTLCTVSCGRLGCACSFLLEEASSPSVYLRKRGPTTGGVPFWLAVMASVHEQGHGGGFILVSVQSYPGLSSEL